MIGGGIYRRTYQVFLNFRGQDTRNGFTTNLYRALCQRGVRTFLDEEGLERGEEITPALFRAIEESEIAIIIFSKNYASSTFCLDELVKILEGIRGKGRLVWPVFYDVDPSDVRHQRGSYGESLAKHERRYDEERVQKWRLALFEAANLRGWHFKHGYASENAIIERIVDEVFSKINCTFFHARVQEVNSLLSIGLDDIRVVGIYGIGGIGKTTIAHALYDLIADQFDGAVFLANVREISMKGGLVQLQEMILSEIFGETDIKVGDVYRGIAILKRRLHQMKILLILDDVDNLEQLHVIAGGPDWFGVGSRIIITTRDQDLLDKHGVEEKYEAKEFSQEEALELFSRFVFRSNQVHPAYLAIFKRAVNYIGGLPLALEVIGASLFGKSIDEWNSVLDKLYRIPDRDIHKMLKVSYDALDDHEKNIFLDIACCFKGDTLAYVKDMLAACDFMPEIGISRLIEKSLIKIEDDRVIMHGLIQDMGRNIVHAESPIELGRRSRLWFYEDILHVLKTDTGTEHIEVINLDLPQDKLVHWSGKAFKKMKNLRTLIIRSGQFSRGPNHLPSSLRVLEWSEYPSSSFPSDFHPLKLMKISMPNSVLQSGKSLKEFGSLGFMDFRRCKYLRRVPDLSRARNLKELRLDSCSNLIKVHESVGLLHTLKILSVSRCTKLRTFVNGIRLTSLEILNFSGCSNLQSFPKILGAMENIKSVFLCGTAIKKLPSSVKNLIGLQMLDLKACKRLTSFPASIKELQSLRDLRCDDCELLQEIRIPPKLKKMSAINCKSLASTSINKLLSQELHEAGETAFVLPGAEIPKWFHHRSRGSSVSFWFRKKFPAIALCVFGDIDAEYWNPQFKFRLRINGTKHINLSYRFLGTLVDEHTLLFDLQCKLPEEGKFEGVLLEHDWNNVEVSCALFCDRNTFWENAGPSAKEMACGSIKWSGIHVYKQKTTLEDIKFTQ